MAGSLTAQITKVKATPRERGVSAKAAGRTTRATKLGRNGRDVAHLGAE